PDREVALRPRVVGVVRERSRAVARRARPADEELAPLAQLDLELLDGAEEIVQRARRLVEVLAQLVVVDEMPDGPLTRIDLVGNLLEICERLVELLHARANARGAPVELGLPGWRRRPRRRPRRRRLGIRHARALLR